MKIDKCRLISQKRRQASPDVPTSLLIDLFVGQNKTITEISKIVKRDRKTIYQRLKRNGVTIERKHALPINDRNDIFTGTDSVGNYWLGFLMADGCVSCSSAGVESVLSVSLAQIDILHLEKFKAYLHCDNKIGLHTKGKAASLRFQNKKIVDKIKSFGVTRNKTFNGHAIGLEENIDFWRGVLDGDGCITLITSITKYRLKKSGLVKNYYYPRPCLELVGSSSLLQQWVNFCKKHIETKAKIIKHKSIWKFSLSGVAAVAMIKLLWDNSAVSLDRKKMKAEEVKHVFDY